MDGFHRIRVKGFPYATSIMRYAGLRVSFHITHSLNCQETVEIAEKRMELARIVDPDKAKLIEALLRMPHSWDVLKGLAVIRTPIFYLITSSVPSKERHVVEVEYDAPFWPKESKRGLVFPFSEVK